MAATNGTANINGMQSITSITFMIIHLVFDLKHSKEILLSQCVQDWL